MGQSSISLFLPVYLREDLDYSSATVGIFLSMAQLVGIGSQPLMGYLSDRVGHKRVLIPAMLCLGMLFAALAFVEGDIGLALTILALGAFLYSLHSIFISAAIGVVGGGFRSVRDLLRNGALPRSAGQPRVLVTSPFGQQIGAIAVSADTLYWGTYPNQALGEVRSMPLAGGPSALVAENVIVTQLYLDGSTLYYVTTDRVVMTSLVAVPATGGTSG